MTRRTPVPRGALLGAALCAALGAWSLGACSSDDVRAALDRGPAPTLEREWVIPGLDHQVEQTGAHHWMTTHVLRSGVGRGTTFTYAGLSIVDARTGEVNGAEQRDDLVTCLGPDVISPDGLAPVLVEPAASRAPTSPVGCTQLAMLDASTGELTVVAEGLDLKDLGPELALAVDEEVVAVVDRTGRAVCHGIDGTVARPSDPRCEALADRATGADLPTLLDPEGNPVPLATRFDPQPEAHEIGRTDDVVLVRVTPPEGWVNGEAVRNDVVRAHDLRTGETLWTDDELTTAPFVVDTWSRDETYFVAPSGIARVSYEHPEHEALVASTPMVVTAVDPRTGKHVKEVARMKGALFSHQFGDITVAHTSQDLRLRATISGYRLPRW